MKVVVYSHDSHALMQRAKPSRIAHHRRVPSKRWPRKRAENAGAGDSHALPERVQEGAPK